MIVARRLVLVFGCALAGGLCVAAPALATSEWRQASSFGSGILAEPDGVAVDQLDGDVFVANHGNVQSFIPVNRSTPSAGYTTGTPLAGPFKNAVGVAVDGSSGPNSGEVYVADAPAKAVYKFIGPGKANEGEPGVPAQIGAGAAPIALGRAAAVAVDPADGDIYIADSINGVIDVYEPSGAFVDQFATGSEPSGLAFDGSGSGLYVDAEGAGRVEEFDGSGNPVDQTAGPHAGTNIVDSSEDPEAVAVDPATEDVYVSQIDDQTVAEFASSGAPLTPAGFSIGFYDFFGLAVDGSTGAVYAPNLFSGSVEVFQLLTPPVVNTGIASHVSETSATLEGTVNPEGVEVSSCEFEYGTSTSYGHSAPCVPAAASIGSGTEPVGVHAEVSGLTPHATYHFRLVAGNAGAASDGADQTFGPPLVDGESFSEVYVASASLGAQLDTEGHAGEYWFEYGPSTAYGSSTPHVSIAAGAGTVEAAAQLEGLQAGNVYHARVVVTDEDGSTQGADFTLTTFSASAYGLPDGRVFEMVTPGQNEEANAYVPLSGFNGDATVAGYFPFQAASDGSAVAYVAEPTTGGNGNSGGGGGNEYLATRAPGGGWTQTNVVPLGNHNAAYQAFSSDLAQGVLTSFEEPTLTANAPGAHCSVLYSRTSGDGTYHALFTTTPPNRSCGEFGTAENGGSGPVRFAGGNTGTSSVPAWSHMLFEANDALTAPAEEDAPTSGQNDLYDSQAGNLSLVNVLPDGKADPNAVFGSPPPPRTSESPDFSHVISADGSRIFWTDLNTNDLYMRENGTSTVPVSAGPAQFWTATPDGRYVYFTEGEALHRGGGSEIYGYEELYRFDVETDKREVLAGKGAGVQGVIGVNEEGEDGAYVYFVANGVLTSTPNARGEGAVAGDCAHVFEYGKHCNLYLLHEGQTTFIATLSSRDDENSEAAGLIFGDWSLVAGLRTAEVSRDGGSVTFVSRTPLTGYVAEGQEGPLEEVFVYDADANRVYCASCNPSGEPPSITAFNVVGGAAARLPTNVTYQPRLISADGSRVFFDSIEPLVPQDTNGKQDVYEWERDGSGACQQSNGCVYLLSGGASTDGSFFIDASENGDDVFIVSRARLTPEDPNDNFNLFDARVDGAQALAAPACTGTGCQGVPSAPPIFATPSSVTFDGVGNFPPPAGAVVAGKSKPLTRTQKLSRALRACKAKRGRRKRVACEAAARRRYGAAVRSRKSKRGGGR